MLRVCLLTRRWSNLNRPVGVVRLSSFSKLDSKRVTVSEAADDCGNTTKRLWLWPKKIRRPLPDGYLPGRVEYNLLRP